MHLQMAPRTSFLQSCCKKGYNVSHLLRGMCLEVERAYCKVGAMRFDTSLHSSVSRWYSHSKFTSKKKTHGKVSGYSTTSKLDHFNLLKKASVLMGYNNLQDFNEQERVPRECVTSVNGWEDEVDISLACGRFPCMKLGDSSFIELYDEISHQEGPTNFLLPGACNRYFPLSLGGEWAEPSMSETWPLLAQPLKSLKYTVVSEETPYTLSHDSQGAKPEFKAYLDAEAAPEKPAKRVGPADNKVLETAIPADVFLDKAVNCIPAITSRQYRQLENCGFHTVRKLLHHFPRTYADLQNAEGMIADGAYHIFVGKVLSSRGIKASFSFSFLEVVVACEFVDKGSVSGDEVDHGVGQSKVIYIHLKKFFRGTRFTYQPFLKNLQSKFKEGDRVYVSGKVKTMRAKDHFEMREYSIDMLEDEEERDAHVERKPYPLYPSKAGLKPGTFRDIILRALNILPADIDPFPEEFLKEFNLVNLHDAYMGIHCPKSLNEADIARRRLIFDEFFYLQLGRLFQMLEALDTCTEKEELLHKYERDDLNAVPVRAEDWSGLTKDFLNALPYCLTPSQLNAVSEIILDLKRPVPMYRLLQGDVGCGKTVVAFLACMEVIGSGFQAAFMVPTELLAVQHYEHLLSLVENIGDDCRPTVALLTGSTPAKQSRLILKGLLTGDIRMVIGTQSLISERVRFSALRIAVVDEQHRFGVIQRGRFNSKLYSLSTSLMANTSSLDEPCEDNVFMAPHVLAMSATPIPRTLALALYGDMSLTQITDLPPGRTPVETFVFEGNEVGFENVFQMMRDELVSGGKVYLVYPVIEESEQLPQLHAATADVDSMSNRFEDYQCGLLHGRMGSEEKDEALKKFRSGETQILLATQVIEIGVDVPDASMMVVMNAERFGIAQLHQLRGRVGRGARKSRCVFLSSTSGTVDRLKVLEKSSDGFFLANADLVRRGPGDLLGKKQSGHLPEFPIARLEIDGNMLQEAHRAAMKILGACNDLEDFPRIKTELSMRQPLCILGD